MLITIEGKKYPDIKEKIYAKGIKQRPPSSSLLASFPSVFTNERTWFDSSIGHDSIPNQIETTADRVSGNIDISETSFNQNSAFKTVTRQFSPSKASAGGVHMIQNGISQVSFDQTTTEQIGRIQPGFPKNSSFQTRVLQNSTSKIGFSEIDTLQRSFPKIGSSQVDSLKTDSPKLSTLISTKMSESNTSEISFSPIVSDDQFFDTNAIHSSSPQIISELNNSATNIWSDLLQSSTQLDIDFQITDLPKGQLAEATIIGFDDSGIPNAGIIEIDHDANGVGWFIDRTPLENSEFTAQNTGRKVGWAL